MKLARFQADEIALVMDLKMSFTPDTIHMACDVGHHVAGWSAAKASGVPRDREDTGSRRRAFHTEMDSFPFSAPTHQYGSCVP